MAFLKKGMNETQTPGQVQDGVIIATLRFVMKKFTINIQMIIIKYARLRSLF